MDNFVKNVILAKKVQIKIDDYNSFHGQHRWDDFQDIAHYLSLFFLYNYIPFWKENISSNLDSLVNKEIKVLGLWDGHYGLGASYCVQNDDWLIKDLSELNLESFDVIFNLFDSEIYKINNKNRYSYLGLDKAINDNQIKLKENCIYISFKSGNASNKKLDLFKLNLKQTFSSKKDEKYPLILKDLETKNKFKIQYGPWPLDYLDWKTFKEWKKP